MAIGAAVPALLPKLYTHYAAALLFAYFGVKLLREAREAGDGAGGGGGEPHGELGEAEAEVAKLSIPGASASSRGGGDAAAGGGAPGGAAAAAAAGGGGAATAPSLELAPQAAGDAGLAAAEAGEPAVGGSAAGLAARARGAAVAAPAPAAAAAAAAAPAPPSPAAAITAAAGLAWGAALCFAHVGKHWPVLSHAFTITFLAEWGDRSQIATIAMAAAQNGWGVCLGAILGHSLCTGIAVVGGRLLASRISEKTVAYVGGALFLLFALHSLVVGPDVDE